MASFIQLLVSGLATGAIYALIAVGFTLLWQTSQTINFAQGEFVMLPAFFMLAAMNLGAPFWLACADRHRALDRAPRPAVQAHHRRSHAPSRRAAAGDLHHRAVAVPQRERRRISIARRRNRSRRWCRRPIAFFRRGDLDAESRRARRSPSSRSWRLHLVLNKTRTRPPDAGDRAKPDAGAHSRHSGASGWCCYTFLINAVLVAIASILISPIYLAKFTNGETLGHGGLHRRHHRRLQSGARRHFRRHHSRHAG